MSNSKQLHQEATRVRRTAKWLADDYLRVTQDLAGYRNIIRLRRRFLWYCGFFDNMWIKIVREALKHIYAPAIADLFQRQTALWDYFKGAHYDGQARLR